MQQGFRLRRITNPNICNSGWLTIKTRPKTRPKGNGGRPTKEKLNLKKQIASKSDKKKYCYIDPFYAELADRVKFLQREQRNGRSGKGLSALQTQRIDMKTKILRDLPFGPILETLEND